MPVGSKLITLLSPSFHLRHFTALRLVFYSRHPVAAFSSAAAYRIRFHSALAHPKPLFCSRVAAQFNTEVAVKEECGKALTSFPGSNSYLWPEWLKLVGLLAEKGYSDQSLSSGEDDDSFSVAEDLPDEFVTAAKACLGFARDRPDILRLLTKKNIESVVLNGSPFLFKNGEISASRMKLFLTGKEICEFEHKKAQTIDIMRYLLSYAYSPLSAAGTGDLKADELVERSVQKLLGELYNLSGTVWKSKSAETISTELPSSYMQFWPPGQYTDMTSGNLIYPKLPGQPPLVSSYQPSALSGLTSTEHRKNSVFYQKQDFEECPSGRSRDGSDSGYTANSTPLFGNSPSNDNSRLLYGTPIPTTSPKSSNLWSEHLTGHTNINSTPPSSNSWSSNTHDPQTGTSIGQPLNSSQPSSNPSWSNTNTSSDPRSNYHTSWSNYRDTNHKPYNGHNLNSSQPSPSDYQCGYNTRLAANSTQTYSNNSWIDGNTSYNGFTEKSVQPPNNSSDWRSVPHSASNSTSLGGPTRNSFQPPTDDSWNRFSGSYAGAATGNSAQPSDGNWSDNYNKGGNGGYRQANSVLEVAPLNAQTQNATENGTYGFYSGKSLEGSLVKELDPLDMSEEAKAERWFRRAAQIKDISELSQIPDEDFPQIMPMRKGVNRFVVSKRKTPLERRMASQLCKILVASVLWTVSGKNLKFANRCQ